MKSKKKLLPFLVFCSALALASCGGSSDSSTPTSSTTPASSFTSSFDSSSQDSSSTDSSTSSTITITSVEINGPTSVYVGSSITLTAGVNGDSENEVNWLSLTPNIASVDENGVVTGLAEGTAFIQATASKDSSKYATYEVSVTLRKETPTSLSVSLTGDGVTYNSETGRYSIEVGTSFQINYETDVENPIDPYDNGVYYTLLADDNGTSYEQYVTVNRQTGASTVNMAAENVVLRVQVAFPISQNNYVYGQASFLTVDTTLDTINSYADKVSESVDLERSRAASATVRRNRKVVTTTPTYDSETGTTTYVENVDLINKDIEYTYYTDAVYMTETEPYSNTSGSGLNTTYGYSGIQNGGYYNFTYVGASSYNRTYDVITKNETGREDDAPLAYNYDSSSIYGITGNLYTILTDADYLGLPAFGLEAARTNLTLRDYGNSVYLTSSYETSENREVALDLFLSFLSDGSLSYYRFNSTVLENGEITSDLSETAELEYTDNKQADSQETNSSYQDISSLGMTQIYSLTNLYGRTTDQYDFNNDKYNVTYSYNNGSYFASMEPDRAFAFSLNGSGSAALSNFTITVADAEDYTIINNDGTTTTPDEKRPVATVTELGNGVFVVNNAFTSNGNFVTGTSEVTISSGSAEFAFNVTFTDFGEPTSITLTGIYTSTTYSIFQNEESTAFRVSVEPTYNSYDLVLNVFDRSTNEPVEDALELVSSSSTSLGNVNVYAVKGLKPGNYSFNIGVEGYDLVSSTYNIDVLEPLTDESINENIIGSTFYYGSSSNLYATFYFDSTTSELVIEQENYGYHWTDKISYTVSNGAIQLSGGTTVSGLEGEYYQLATEGEMGAHNTPMYGYIRTDVNVTLTSSLDTIGLQLVNYGYFYVNSVTLSKYPNLSDYSYTNAYWYNNGSPLYIDMTINEDQTSGTFTFKNYSTSEELGTATFDIEVGLFTATITNVVESGDNGFTTNWNEEITASVSPSGSYVYVTLSVASNSSISFTGRAA